MIKFSHAAPLASMLCLGVALHGCAAAKSAPETTQAPAQEARTQESAPDPLTPRQKQLLDQVVGAMNKTQDPCQDFYEYACGGWLKQSSVPEDQSRWMRSFNVISEDNDAALKTLLEQHSTPSNKAQSFYQACVDESNIQALGAKPLEPWLKEVEQVKDLDSMMSLLARWHGHGIGGLFGFWVSPDAKEPTQYAVYTRQGGLGLPDRAFYLEERHKESLAAYEQLMVTLMTHAGLKQPKQQAAQALAIEQELAKASLPRAELRDPEKRYNKRSIKALEKESALPWQRYINARGLDKAKDVIVQVPSFTDALPALLKRQKPEAWRAYLRWNLIREAAPMLDKRFEEAHFSFYGQRLNGQKAQKPRWKRCVRATDSALGFELGKDFVDAHFNGESKTIAQQLVATIEEAFAQNLNDVSWMDPQTRQRALGKLKTIHNKIGYPDEWRSYEGLELIPGDYFNNSVRASAFEIKRRTARYQEPVDFGEWYMTPPTVNAYYSPSGNQIVFPAGILQGPFFDQDFPMSINFGGIGMVIGHEITHGFDDGGRKFDEKGRLTMWWQPEAIAAFEERAKCVDEQYQAIEVQPSHYINGKLTLGENIADLGGLKIAYLGLERWLKTRPEASLVEGLSPQQLFFVGFAQTWCGVGTPENEQQRLLTDSHSPPRYRVNQSVSNLPAFHAAFSCAADTPMNPPKQCRVW